MKRRFLLGILGLVVCLNQEFALHIPKDSLIIREGIVCSKEQIIKLNYEEERRYEMHISDPYLVAQADQDEKWGFFQFPNIGKSKDGTLIVSWQMKPDSHLSYGEKTLRDYSPMMSKDGGVTWKPQDKSYNLLTPGYNVYMSNGGALHVITPKTKDISSYEHFPEVVIKKGNRAYYLMDSLPDELQGAYLKYVGNNRKSKNIHAKLNDPGLLRCAIGGMMPVVWWGNIKELSDQKLIAGVYPAHYKDSVGNVTIGGVSFYASEDEGLTWNICGKIPLIHDGIADQRGEKRFSEPAFEILSDSSFICVMRTGSDSPMYKTYSYDHGKTWTVPTPFTPNGVMPRLLLLKNGVLVLASGRPGIQLRFSFDGKGRVWSEPIDMIPFMNADGSYIRDVSCGYASIIEAGNNSFYLVYSDFTTKNSFGQVRKSIWFRKVVVNL